MDVGKVGDKLRQLEVAMGELSGHRVQVTTHYTSTILNIEFYLSY